MTAQDVRETVRTAPLPRPRTSGDEMTAPGPTVAAPKQTGTYPWPEPWRSSRAARPRTEFWDVETASWRSRGPVPAPPAAD